MNLTTIKRLNKLHIHFTCYPFLPQASPELLSLLHGPPSLNFGAETPEKLVILHFRFSHSCAFFVKQQFNFKTSFSIRKSSRVISIVHKSTPQVSRLMICIQKYVVNTLIKLWLKYSIRKVINTYNLIKRVQLVINITDTFRLLNWSRYCKYFLNNENNAKALVESKHIN